MRMQRGVVKTVTGLALMALAALSAGCYEDLSPESAQTSQPPPKQGPITSVGDSSQPALGKARQSATNVADQAEQRSRQVADEADKLMDPDRNRPGAAPAEEPKEP